MYRSVIRVQYKERSWKMDAGKSITAVKSSGEELCIFCEGKIQKGDRVIAGDHRVGTKLIGKTIHVESCLSCAREFKALIDLRIGEAERIS